MSSSPSASTILNGILRILGVGLLLWLAMIAPFASILAMLDGQAFYAKWLKSLLFLPWPFVLLAGVFRSKNAKFRWTVFQYLGVSSVCFSAALLGIALSVFIANALAGKIAVLACFIFCAWAIYSAHRIHVVKLNIASSKVNSPVRLVQISDVHVGSRQAAYLEKVVRLVNIQQPDILLITGDLLDENVSENDLASLSNLSYPAFYCSGNHERYVNYKQVLEYIANQGVTVLSDSAALCNGIQILGVEDRQHVSEAQRALDTVKTKSALDPDQFSVLLYHQPDLWDAAKKHDIDLTLSGHTHKGQIWPFGLLVRTRYRYVAGLFKAASNHLFVSQGTGTWGPIMRFGTRCEITVIELTQAEN